MKVYGIDFTSAPSHRKPITCADCTLENGFLHLNDLKNLETFNQFDEFLANGTEWIAGIDFPFGQPRKLICNLGWPLSWDGYVGKMFFKGAPRMLKSGASILPCHKNGSQRIVVEAYPKLVAKKLISKPQYKNDTKKKQTSQLREAWQEIMKKLKSDSIILNYGFDVELKDDFAVKIIEDPTGDCLDAFLCAIQAGWAYEQRERGYGIPEGFELEGWIVDPELNIISKRENRFLRLYYFQKKF